MVGAVGRDALADEALAGLEATGVQLDVARTGTTGIALILVAVSFAASGPTQTSRPTVTGALRVGAKLTAKPGSWTGRGAIGYAYQWSRCDANGARCSSIHGATRGSYVEVAADAGHTLALRRSHLAHRAVIAASLSVARAGPREGMPRADELEHVSAAVIYAITTTARA